MLVLLLLLTAVAGIWSASSVDESSKICWNGGTEIGRYDGSVTCVCSAGFGGPRCRDTIPIQTACMSAPCQNGAACVDDADDGYRCRCAVDFHGGDCQHRKDYCAAIYNDGNNTFTAIEPPCGPVGRCVNDYETGRIRCVCLDAAYGPRCQFGPCDPPSVIDCGPNGSCVAVSNGTTAKPACRCDDGFKSSGTGFCDVDVDDCLPTICQNGGICVDKPNGFECRCTWPFIGQVCQNNISRYANDSYRSCKRGGCANGGVCEPFVWTAVPQHAYTVDAEGDPYWPQDGDGPNAPVCVCPYRYAGRACEIKVDRRSDIEIGGWIGLACFLIVMLLATD